MPRQGGGLSSLRALNFGRKFGDYNRDANYGPTGQPLGPRDVALSPNQMGKYPMGSHINATAGGKNLGTYTVADPSYLRPGVPTRNTIEFRNRLLSGQGVNISSTSNPYGFVQGGIDIFGDYPSPPSSGFQSGPTLPGQFQQAYRGGTYNPFTDPTQDTSATPPPSAPAPTLTPFDPMGYGSAGSNIPPNEDVSPGLSTNFQYSGIGNIPPNEDVSPGIINTFLGNQTFNTAPARRYPVPGVGGIPSMNWATNASNNPVYPVPGVGGFPSTYGGGQSWQSNARNSNSPYLGLGPGAWLGRGAGLIGSLIGGLGSSFSGGQSVSNIPEYSGFAGPGVGRASAGPLQP